MKSLYSADTLCSRFSAFLFTLFIPQQNQLLLSPFTQSGFSHHYPSSATLLQADIKNTVKYKVKWLQTTCSSCEKAIQLPCTEKFPGPSVLLHSQPFSNCSSHQQTEVLAPSQEGQVRKWKCLADPVTEKESYCNSHTDCVVLY